MNVVKLIADSPQDALEKVRDELGVDAVILNVRPVQAGLLKRMWNGKQVEVLATKFTPERSEKEAMLELATRVGELEEELTARGGTGVLQSSAPNQDAKLPAKLAQMIAQAQGGRPEAVALPAVQVLEELGLLPSHARWLSAQARNFLGGTKPRNLIEEMELLRDVLSEYWNQIARRVEKPGNPVRVLVGPPGTGKTTALCKWMTQESLVNRKPVRVWRLDGDRSNAAEFLSLHGELMQIPVERFWDDNDQPPEDTMRFVDLPGVATNNPDALEALARGLEDMPPMEIQLVLNASYDLGLLLRQARAFSHLPLAGILLTHIDEAERWSKVWNVMLATQLPITFLSGGQDIPGDFHRAIPENLFDAFVNAGLQTPSPAAG